MIETNQPNKKLVENYYSLVTLNADLIENTIIDIKPNI